MIGKKHLSTYGTPTPSGPDSHSHQPHRYIYRIVLGGDGNHSLNKKAKKLSDPNDVSLAAGKGFFVTPELMHKIVSKCYDGDATKLVSL